MEKIYLCIGRYNDAVKLVKWIAKTNKSEIDEKHIEEVIFPMLVKDDGNEKMTLVVENDDQFGKNYSIFTIIKYPRVMMRFFIMCFVE